MKSIEQEAVQQLVVNEIPEPTFDNSGDSVADNQPEYTAELSVQLPEDQIQNVIEPQPHFIAED